MQKLSKFSICGCSSVDRVLASEAKGRGFDPRQPHHQFIRRRNQAATASFKPLAPLPCTTGIDTPGWQATVNPRVMISFGLRTKPALGPDKTCASSYKNNSSLVSCAATRRRLQKVIRRDFFRLRQGWLAYACVLPRLTGSLLPFPYRDLVINNLRLPLRERAPPGGDFDRRCHTSS